MISFSMIQFFELVLRKEDENKKSQRTTQLIFPIFHSELNELNQLFLF
ncbi:hypothetical protein RV18_GL000234 [Enterococcus termitis]|nr:hypothetical protein RV18_GL000234 [Enterococcus termitis]